MNNRSRPIQFQVLALVAMLASLAFVACREQDDAADSGSRTAAADQAPLVEKEIPDLSRELIAIASETAAALPVNPHIKTRSRLQDSVVDVCLDLGRPVTAMRIAQSIGDWRRGLGYAKLALYAADRGDRANAEIYLRLAEKAADEAMSEDIGQSWRRDRIRVAMAQAWAALGERDRSVELEQGLVDSEWGKVDRVRARELPAADFDAEVVALDAIFKTANLDQARAALETFVALHDRFYGDEDRRSALTERISSSYAKLPMDIRIGLMLELVEHALNREDDREAMRLLERTTEFASVGNWLPEARIPLDARLAALRFRAGDEAQGRSALDAVFSRYVRERTRIVDIFRARALCPLAEAYRAIGDSSAALTIYKKAVVESGINPNSRPRAEDLTAICCSLVRSGIEPDDELMSMIRNAREGLGQPW